MTSGSLSTFLCWIPQKLPARWSAKLLRVHTHFPLWADFASSQRALSDECQLGRQGSCFSCSILPTFAKQLDWSFSRNPKTLPLGSQSSSGHFCTIKCSRSVWRGRDIFGKGYSRSSYFWSKGPKMLASRNHQQTWPSRINPLTALTVFQGWSSWVFPRLLRWIGNCVPWLDHWSCSLWVALRRIQGSEGGCIDL